MLDLPRLLDPIHPNTPCGEDLSFSAELDAIARARQADDPTLDQGAWVSDLKEADWPLVAARCSELLSSRSKDLQLAVWLAEAHAHQGDTAALADSLRLIARLCQHYWEGLHPLPDEAGPERRIGNLCWLAAQLPQWIAQQQQPGELANALRELEAAVDLRLGADGPSFSPAMTALERFPAPCENQPDSAPAGDAPANGGALQTRAQAIAQLRSVAAWFRANEPHSPVALLAERAAAWGEQNLEQWLRSVIKDHATLAQLEETLGLGPRADG
ncbi:type VI secretion system ImpA family N-terminal domain-containing protein [Massilia sp. TS11]|uniref:type VI secretion system ImpA family N-terminal domain-containing protein n=1 Tax=Massilia sp. TS11 TaxID=2908003 RepID=UPI001EDC1CE2|nr:type VI secretion system ImpA family N-terminal domain-containing protein [Massilia sp. TS11]MCG2584198.1 type VI secretion system ImpA family N-terminal domain-containing protein [Massilia sp. TS11]